MTACSLTNQFDATVSQLEQLADEVYRVRLECPPLAQAILPGQFLMLRMPQRNDPLLGRPFALYDTVGDPKQPTALDIGFHVVGKMTSLMETLQPGEQLEVWGPLGNGFPELETTHLLQVAGGIGYTPFVAVSREALLQKTYGTPARSGIRAERGTLIYGVKSARFAARMDDLADLSGKLDIEVCTEDGSTGYEGLVTGPLRRRLAERGNEPTTVLTCGPLVMMRVVAEICREFDVPCLVSLETPMACGFGACFSCVVPVVTGPDEWDYQRSCMEGPVFEAERIHWEQMMGKK